MESSATIALVGVLLSSSIMVDAIMSGRTWLLFTTVAVGMHTMNAVPSVGLL